MKKRNKTQRINAMLASHPELSAKEIAKRLKVSPNLVHQVKWKTKQNSEFINKVFIKAGKKKKPTYDKLSENYTSNLAKAIKNTTAEFAALEEKQDWGIALETRDHPPADLVNHPPHYKTGGIETIDFIEAKDLNYRLGNVIKYVSRAEKKGNPIEDLKKARWYLDREINARERA